MREDNRKDYIKISKNKLKKITLGALIVGSLASTASNFLLNIAEEAHCRNQGAEFITQEVNNSGVFPEHLSARDDSQSGIVFSYVDMDGNRVNVVDSEAFINDIVVEAIDDYGFSADEMAVALEYGYDYSGVKGSTEEGMEQAKMAAYHQKMQQELSGRSM